MRNSNITVVNNLAIKTEKRVDTGFHSTALVEVVSIEMQGSKLQEKRTRCTKART